MSDLANGGVTRADYSWNDATKDLALLSTLTLRQAHTVTYALEKSTLHPYDALPHLARLFGGTPEIQADALAELIKLGESDG